MFGSHRPSTLFGEAQVRIDGAHINMTNINTLKEQCCMNAFISDRVSKHNSQALPENMPSTPMTSAEHLNQREMGHCLSRFCAILSH